MVHRPKRRGPAGRPAPGRNPLSFQVDHLGVARYAHPIFETAEIAHFTTPLHLLGARLLEVRLDGGHLAVALLEELGGGREQLWLGGEVGGERLGVLAAARSEQAAPGVRYEEDG